MPDLEQQIQYATFNQRLGAYAIDMHIIAYVAFILYFPISALFGDVLITAIILGTISIIGTVLYYTLQEGGKYHGTLGKRAGGMIVVSKKSMQPISYMQAFLRFSLSAALSSIVSPLHYILVGISKEGAGLHDQIVGSRVIIVNDSSNFTKYFFISLLPLVIGLIIAYFMGYLTMPNLGGYSYY